MYRAVSMDPFLFIWRCFLHNKSCEASERCQQSAKQRSSGIRWVDKLPECGKVTGLTNRFSIMAKTIFFSYTISARAPGGTPAVQRCRLFAACSVQDPLTAASRCLKTPGKPSRRHRPWRPQGPQEGPLITWQKKTLRWVFLRFFHFLKAVNSIFASSSKNFAGRVYAWITVQGSWIPTSSFKRFLPLVRWTWMLQSQKFNQNWTTFSHWEARKLCFPITSEVGYTPWCTMAHHTAALWV